MAGSQRSKILERGIRYGESMALTIQPVTQRSGSGCVAPPLREVDKGIEVQRGLALYHEIQAPEQVFSSARQIVPVEQVQQRPFERRQVDGETLAIDGGYALIWRMVGRVTDEAASDVGRLDEPRLAASDELDFLRWRDCAAVQFER